MTTATRLSPLRYTWLLGALVLAACASEPTEPTDRPALLELTRKWHFGTFPLDGGPEDPGVVDSQVGGEVHEFHDYGGLIVVPDPSFDPRADSEVFSSADGVTYYVSTEGAPAANGSNVVLEQFMSFRKDSSDASLVFTITGISLVAIDDNVDNPTCINDTMPPGLACESPLYTLADVDLIAYDDSTTLFQGHGGPALTRRPDLGRQGWSFALFGGDFFEFDDFTRNFSDSDPFLARPALMTLNRSIPIPVDISRVGLGEEFTVRAIARVLTHNVMRRESYTSAFLRDPAGIGGTIAFTGLEPTNNPLPPPPPGTWDAAPECTTPNAAAGVLQFSAPAFSATELPLSMNPITVTRTGGTSGPVSATFTTSDGTAAAGQHYVAVTTTVAFRDGDDQPRTVSVPVIANTTPDPTRTVNLSLSDPRGCATLGASSAVLNVQDDDQPVAAPVTTVGGTVSGLAGVGLVLRNDPGGEELPIAADGPFVFALATPTGIDYSVEVAAQPTGPAQVCLVINGSGTMGTTAVTNVAVNCVTPTNGALDPAFGGDGIVQTPLAGAIGGEVAVQADGRIVVAGTAEVAGTEDFALARYNADGSLDTSFGTGGIVTTPFSAGSKDEGLDVAVQSDGRIVVVGRSAASGIDFDFAIARYSADGNLDPSFGGDGTVITDFGAGLATARAVVIQPDGRILVVGDVGADFALARYEANGTLDGSFGSGGITTADATGGDIGHAVALLSDGRFLVAGGGATGIEKDFCLVRFEANGSVDGGFGSGGHVTTDIGGVDEAFDLVVQPDGRIVLAGSIDAPPGAIGVDFALARYDANGGLDGSFGNGGTVTTNFSAGRDRGAALARQSDGKLVMAGLTTSGSFAFNNFALARYLVNGSLDTNFGVDGRLAIDVGGGHSAAEGVAIQADGRIVAAGTAGNSLAVVRVLP